MMADRDPSIGIARNQLGVAVRTNGNVAAARGTLEFTKARRALREALAVGISPDEHQELSQMLADTPPRADA